MLAGFGEPVQRSFWMVTLYLLRACCSGNAIAPQRDRLCGRLPARARSSIPSGASFQMTLLSVLIVAGVAVPVAEHTFGPYLQAARSLGLVAIDPRLPPGLAQFRVTLRLVADHLQPLIGRRFAWFLPPAFVRLTLRVLELLLVSALIETGHVPSYGHHFHRSPRLVYRSICWSCR